MIQFVEPFIQKKILLAQNIYLYKSNIPDNIIRELDISKSTFVKWHSEIASMYKQEKQRNGITYTTDTLQKIINHLIADSTQIEILRMFFLEPGHQASYYKEKISISDSSFSRKIAHLKDILKDYNVSITSKPGYFIDGKNEWELAFLLTHLFVFFKWKISDVDRIVEKITNEKVLLKINTYDFSKFTFNGIHFEVNFFKVLSKILLIRDFQLKSLMKEGVSEKCVLEATLEYLETNLKLNKNKVNNVY